MARKSAGVDHINVPTPTGCHLWKMKNISPSSLEFEKVKTYVESSHFDRYLSRCKKCGQLYFSEFVEFVLWEEDDKMYCNYIPVESVEQADELSELHILEILGVTPRLLWDHDMSVYWVR